MANVVLVHGAWADGSGWRGVYDILTRDGHAVRVVANPLTSFADDVAATDRVLDRMDAPVVLVGHSYGGAVISEAGDHPKVAALVYIAAFAPDIGESISSLLPAGGPPLPIEISQDGFAFFERNAFTSVIAESLDPALAAFAADAQVPIAIASFSAPLSVAAWRNKPSWYLLASADRIIPPELQRQMATRAGATVMEAQGGHLGFMAQPEKAAVLIKAAVASTTSETA